MHDEDLVPLRRLAPDVPSGRTNGHVHEKTLSRWGRVGLRGVRLELTKVGGTVCSSRSALRRFFARLTALDGLVEEPPGATRLTSRQEQAEREADELLGPS